MGINYELISDDQIDKKIKIEKPTLWNKTMNICSEKIEHNFKEDKIQKINNDIDKNNIIFKVIKSNLPDLYNIYIYEDKINKNLIKFDYALVPTLKISKFLNKLFTKENFEKNMECKFSSIFKKWIPIKEVEKEIDTLQDIENKNNV